MQKFTLKIDLLKFFWLRKVKNDVLNGMVLVIVTEKKLLELFRKNSCKKQIKVSLELKNQSVENVISYILDGKDKVICLIAA